MENTMRSFKVFFRSGSFSSVRFIKATNYTEAVKKAEMMAVDQAGTLAKGPSYNWIAEGVFEQEAR